MDKKTAIEMAGGVSALAELMKVTPSAVSQWDNELPLARRWQLQLLMPKLVKLAKRNGWKAPVTP